MVKGLETFHKGQGSQWSRVWKHFTKDKVPSGQGSGNITQRTTFTVTNSKVYSGQVYYFETFKKRKFLVYPPPPPPPAPTPPSYLLKNSWGIYTYTCFTMCYNVRSPKGGRGCLICSPCLAESQGCLWIPFPVSSPVFLPSPLALSL